MTHMIGQPAIDTNAVGQPALMVTDDMIPHQERILGITTPRNYSVGTNWVQLPTADGAGTMSMGSYGQWQNGAGAPAVGDWAEWNFGAVPSVGWGIYLWMISWRGGNLGKVDVSWNGVSKGTIDTYATGYYNASSFLELEAAVSGASKVPRKNTLRLTIVTKNPSSTANYILLTSLCVYGIQG